jgi:hypothetical protein
MWWFGGGGGGGVELHQRRHSRLGGASSIRVAKKNARCPGLWWGLAPKAWAGWLSYAACSREDQEEKSRCFAAAHKPSRMCNKKPTALHVTRCQVIIARPPVLTP